MPVPSPQVAEGPYSWHSHAILGDSWPNLPSTADLLGVARESNLRPGGRGHVHLVVTPIGTWLLQATEELVQVRGPSLASDTMARELRRGCAFWNNLEAILEAL